MEVAKIIPFPSDIPVNGCMFNDLNNRYFSLFGSYPSNSFGHSLNSSIPIKLCEEMFEENENKENNEKDAENVFSPTVKFYKNNFILTSIEEKLENYNIFTAPCSSLAQASDENNCFSSSSPTKETFLSILNEETNNNYQMNEAVASTSSHFPFNNYKNGFKECKNGTKLEKLQSIAKPSNISNSPKLVHYRFPKPGWDEKLIQRIESFRSFRNIQERVSHFRRHFKKGFRYRSKQRIPLRVQLLKYKCLNSIYGDLELFMQVKKVLDKTAYN
uniref:Uncharacterized protein n=1 Tax=Panagrolaimus sp. ES5 TaxID=591445 RepID=A0AC34F1J2_9BILA